MDELARIGLKLGADVPFCVYRGTMLAEGIGEELSALPSMPKCFILLAKPSFSVSTKTVYERFDKLGDTKPIDIDGVIEALGERNLDKLTRSVGNALEYVTATEYPVITDIKTIMLKAGAIGALMSGSGPTVFGIFRERSAAAGAERAIRGAKLAKQIYITTPYNTKHDILLCIQTNKKVMDEDRMRYEGGQYYVKSAAEMEALFPYAREALENTGKIAERCHGGGAQNGQDR